MELDVTHRLTGTQRQENLSRVPGSIDRGTDFMESQISHGEGTILKTSLRRQKERIKAEKMGQKQILWCFLRKVQDNCPPPVRVPKTPPPSPSQRRTSTWINPG